jgi:hypothetical protein
VTSTAAAERIMRTHAARHLRLVVSAPPKPSSIGDLERRALADLAFRTRCSPSEPLGCCVRCFTRWLRARLVEHWRGERYWEDLDHGDFGLLQRPWHPDATLVADVVALLACGNENLTVIAWALETRRPLDQVVAILTVLDINGRRLPPYAWLTPTNHCRRDALAIA